jgi:hypothetical protein
MSVQTYDREAPSILVLAHSCIGEQRFALANRIARHPDLRNSAPVPLAHR